ncbi:YisL family protein [Bacillus sp. ISL-39]|uniref:YisL family protein n=1 Tax=Bacillus sp. ISL-39 TaxID=2819124 RepID=UPI001BE6CE9B|nr:YisL family protein [Bacillus sp. ISL-39]MBT2639292.1 YisL family protein [Bacillus sp. ISL-39]
MIHTHITAWVLALIIFIVIRFLKQKDKNTKVLHMILRVVYIVTLGTGLMLIFELYQISFLYILKTALGMWMIAVLEMILVKGKRNESVKHLWIQFSLVLAILLYLGFKLPLGFHFFS